MSGKKIPEWVSSEVRDYFERECIYWNWSSPKTWKWKDYYPRIHTGKEPSFHEVHKNKFFNVELYIYYLHNHEYKNNYLLYDIRKRDEKHSYREWVFPFWFGRDKDGLFLNSILVTTYQRSFYYTQHQLYRQFDYKVDFDILDGEGFKQEKKTNRIKIPHINRSYYEPKTIFEIDLWEGKYKLLFASKEEPFKSDKVHDSVMCEYPEIPNSHIQTTPKEAKDRYKEYSLYRDSEELYSTQGDCFSYEDVSAEHTPNPNIYGVVGLANVRTQVDKDNYGGKPRIIKRSGKDCGNIDSENPEYVKYIENKQIRPSLTHDQQKAMKYPSVMAKSKGIRKRYYNSFFSKRSFPAKILTNNSFWLKVDYRKYPKSKDAKVKKIRLVNHYTIDKENVKFMAKKMFYEVNRDDLKDFYMDYILYQDGDSWSAGLSSLQTILMFEAEVFKLYGIELNRYFSIRKDTSHFFTK